MVYQGAWTCRSALSHYIDNVDGTVTDTKTGLMWEKKTTACAGEITCVNDRTYTWTTGDNSPDGTLYTTFLSAMNGQVLVGGSETCFAGYCDWRIPTINELASLVTARYPNCTSPPCIDPTLGPTGGSYWSSSSVAGGPNGAWAVEFANGYAFSVDATSTNYARAVRGGR